MYEKNLQAIKFVDPDLYEKLSNIDTNKKFDVFMGTDPIDINILENQSKQTIYQEPVGDTQSHLDDFSRFSNYTFLFFYGFGNGVFFQALLKNKKHKHIIIVEPEIEIIYIALNFGDFSKDIASSRLVVVHSEDITQARALDFTKLPDIQIYTRTYNLHITTPYYSKFEQDIVRINENIIAALLQAVKNHGNDTRDSLLGIKHFMQNLHDMIVNISFTDLRKSKNSSLVVCVATGPSLTKQLPLLSQIQDKVTIVSVDASFPILHKWGIRPDIVTSLERIEESAKFFENTPKDFHKDVVFVHSALQHKRVLSSTFGQKLIVMRPFGYMKSFGLNDFGYAGIGMSAANLSLEVAYMMGFKKIILIGQDLAFEPSGQTHADDHILGAKDEAFLKNIRGDKYIKIKAWGGKGEVTTNTVWKMFLNFFVQAIADIKGDAVCINATQGGAHIEGSVEMSFSQATKDYQTYPDKTPIKLKPTSIEKQKPYILQISKTLHSMLDLGQEVMEKSLELHEQIGAFLEDFEKNPKNTKDEQIANFIKKIDEIKAYFNDDKFLDYYWEILRSAVVNIELSIAKIISDKPNSKQELKEQNLAFIFSHIEWTSIVAGSLKAQIKIIKDVIEDF